MRAAHIRGACARLSRGLEKCAPSLYLRGESVARRPLLGGVGFRRSRVLGAKSQRRITACFLARTFNISRVFNSVGYRSKLTWRSLVSGELKIIARIIVSAKRERRHGYGVLCPAGVVQIARTCKKERESRETVRGKRTKVIERASDRAGR